MPIRYTDQSFYWKERDIRRALFNFEKDTHRVNPGTPLMEAKAILFRSAFALFTVLNENTNPPVDIIVFLDWMIDATGASKLGDDRFLGVTARSREILMISKRD